MKYLVTDPCYIISNEEWDRLGTLHGWGRLFLANLTNGEKGETIIEAIGTTHGDGSMDYGLQTIGVDSGTVCLAEIPDDYGRPMFGVVVDDYSEARDVFNKALTI